MVSGSISSPCSGCFSPFPHGTGSLSGSEEYLALTDGPARFRQGFTCPAILRILLTDKTISPTGLSPSTAQLSSWFCYHFTSYIAVLQPRYCLNNTGLGYSPFARHYLGNHFCFLLLRVLRCFSSPRSLPLRDDWPSTSRVAPFGYLRINSHLHLPVAFRSLSRPSSPLRAKASTMCPLLLSFSTTSLLIQ